MKNQPLYFIVYLHVCNFHPSVKNPIGYFWDGSDVYAESARSNPGLLTGPV